jgi:hypothetical protein
MEEHIFKEDFMVLTVCHSSNTEKKSVLKLNNNSCWVDFLSQCAVELNMQRVDQVLDVDGVEILETSHLESDDSLILYGPIEGT